MDWSQDEVLSAVRATLSSDRPFSKWTFDRADLEGDDVLVVFRIADELYGVQYTLRDLPEGPSTGMPCDTPERWATEITWVMDEQIDTGGLARAERLPGPSGFVLLRWVW